MKAGRFPAGWDEKRVQKVLAHYERQSQEEAVAEDEAAYDLEGHSMVDVPDELLPKVRTLIAKHRQRKTG